MKVEGIKTHTIIHMWDVYAKRMLADNPNYMGVYHNKMHNFYIFKKGTKSRSVVTQYKGYKTSNKVYSMNGLIFSYPQFRKVITDYLTKAKLSIIKGKAININGVGKICAKRVERNFCNGKQHRINWQKTILQPKIFDPVLGKERYARYIYFTTDDWCRIAWFKNKTLANQTVYEFEPSSASSNGKGGFRTEFGRALAQDKLLKYQYLFQPIYKPENKVVS